MADFVVGPGNAEAVAWLDRWPNWPAVSGLAICGPPGCGKTHLAHVFCARSEALILRPNALAHAGPPDLLGQTRACVIEDADRALELDEQALLHLYNYVVEVGGHILVTGRQPPARWPIRLADLSSRLAAMPMVVLSEPEDELFRAILVKLFAERQLCVGPEVVDYLVRRMERSFSASHRTVALIDRHALASGRNITLPLIRELLHTCALDEDETISNA